jgi:hypothetical protein
MFVTGSITLTLSSSLKVRDVRRFTKTWPWSLTSLIPYVAIEFLLGAPAIFRELLRQEVDNGMDPR